MVDLPLAIDFCSGSDALVVRDRWAIGKRHT